MADQFKNYIEGNWRAAKSGKTFENRNPANHTDLVGLFPASGPDDVDAAVARLAECGAPPGDPLHIKRGWTLPDGEVLDLAFTVATPALDAPPVYCNLCQHHTLHHYLRPEWRQHDNGARSLVAVLVEDVGDSHDHHVVVVDQGNRHGPGQRCGRGSERGGGCHVVDGKPP